MRVPDIYYPEDLKKWGVETEISNGVYRIKINPGHRNI